MWNAKQSTASPFLGECTVGGVTASEQLEEYKTGVQLSATCSIDLTKYQGLQEGTLLLFRVQVSDLGYNQADPADGARTAEVVWVSEINIDEACEDNR
jgi:hypothetical protein